MAEVGSIGIANISSLGSFNSVNLANLASFIDIQFPEDTTTRMYIIGSVNATTKGQVSINDGGSWLDLSTGSLSGTRSAVLGGGVYFNPYTVNRNSWIMAGYNSSNSRCFVTNTQNNWTTQNSSTFSSKYYEFSAMCKDASYVIIGQWSYSGYLRSTDWGKTFSEIAKNPAPLNIAMSDDGAYMYAGSPSTIGNGVYKSTDYGASFIATGITTTQHKLVSCDSTGQYVFAWYTGAHSIYFSSNYGASYTRLNTGASGGYANMFRDRSLMFYSVNTTGDPSNGFVFSTNQGASWTRIAYPNSWTTGVNLYSSNAYKRIYVSRSNAAPQIYKLNDAKNGWDLVYTMEVNVDGVPSTSEFRDEILVADVSRYLYRITPAGVRTGPVYTGSTDRYVPNLY